MSDDGELWPILRQSLKVSFLPISFQSVAGVPQRIASKMTSRTNGVPAQNHTLKTGKSMGKIL